MNLRTGRKPLQDRLSCLGTVGDHGGLDVPFFELPDNPLENLRGCRLVEKSRLAAPHLLNNIEYLILLSK